MSIGLGLMLFIIILVNGNNFITLQVFRGRAAFKATLKLKFFERNSGKMFQTL